MELEGVVLNGVIVPDDSAALPEGTRVRIVPASSELPQAFDEGFTPDEVADLRGKLAAWEDDWNAPGMEAYDAALRNTLGL